MELLDYLPDFMAELEEMQELTKAEQPEIAAAIRTVRAAPDEFFITMLSPAGAKRWEEMLALPVQESAPIADNAVRRRWFYRNHGWQHLYSFRARDADSKTEL